MTNMQYKTDKHKISENIYAWWAAVMVSSTCGDSSYGAHRNTHVSTAFTKFRVWPSVCVVRQTSSHHTANAINRALCDCGLWYLSTAR